MVYFQCDARVMVEDASDERLIGNFLNHTRAAAATYECVVVGLDFDEDEELNKDGRGLGLGCTCIRQGSVRLNRSVDKNT